MNNRRFSLLNAETDGGGHFVASRCKRTCDWPPEAYVISRPIRAGLTSIFGVSSRLFVPRQGVFLFSFVKNQLFYHQDSLSGSYFDFIGENIKSV